jgi:radial spoke head protein 4A
VCALLPRAGLSTRCARSIKKLFTGDLAAKIEGYPVFPGSEADYLRAQVARITADTCIAPAGVYALEDGYEAPGADAENDDRAADPPIAPVEEEYTPPSALTVLTDASGWVHSERQLLKTQGKCGWYKFPEPEEEEVEEGEEPKAKPAPQVPEAAPAALASLSDDAAAADKVPAWSFRASLAGFGGSAVAVAKSLKWPGAVTVGMLAGAAPPTCANVYVGTGAVYEGTPFSPPLPPSVAEEAEDPMEQTDPTAEEEAAANAPAEEEGAEEE